MDTIGTIRADLFGSDRTSVYRGLSDVITAFGVVFVAIAALRVVDLPAGATLTVDPPGAFLETLFLIVGCAVAVANAYRSGGLVPSSLLSVAPLTAWRLFAWHHPGPIADTVSRVWPSSLGLALVGGTAAHAVGRAAADRDASASGPVERLVFGTDASRVGEAARRTGRIALLGAAVAVLTLGHAATYLSLEPELGRTSGLAVAALWIGTVAAAVDRRDGVIAAWWPIFGFCVALVAFESLSNPAYERGPLVALWRAVRVSAAPALLYGTAGYALGAAWRASQRRIGWTTPGE